MLRWVTKSRNFIKLQPRQSNFRFFASEAASSQVPVIQPGLEVKIRKPLPLCCIASRTRPECIGPCFLGNCQVRHICQGSGKPPLMNIDCKVALITGATSPVGMGAADELLNQNAKVVVISGTNDVEGKEAATALNERHGNGRCFFMSLNVTNAKQFEDVFKSVYAKYGSLDILVNNAGSHTDKNWENSINVNINGVVRGILLAYKFMPHCNKGKGGVVVNVSSIHGFDSTPYAPIHTLSKHAVIGMTRSFGDPCHYAENGVRIVALCPGITETCVIKEKKPMLYPEWTEKNYALMQTLPRQSPTATSKALAYVVKHAETGSCWPVEGNVLYKVKIPDRKTFSSKVMDV